MSSSPRLVYTPNALQQAALNFAAEIMAADRAAHPDAQGGVLFRPSYTLREPLEKFVIAMEEQLRSKDPERGRYGWRLDPDLFTHRELFKRAINHFGEAEGHLNYSSSQRSKESCKRIRYHLLAAANYLMMVYDLFGADFVEGNDATDEPPAQQEKETP